MFREIVSASTSEAWIVLTPASIDKISKNACRHFAKKGHIHIPPLVTFTKPRARGFPLVEVWEAGKKSRSLSGIYCCRHDVKQDSVGDKFALTAWMISCRSNNLSNPSSRRNPTLLPLNLKDAFSCGAARSSGLESSRRFRCGRCVCVRLRDTHLPDSEGSLPRDILQRCRSFDWRTWSPSLAYCHPGSRRKTASACYCLHTALAWRS